MLKRKTTQYKNNLKITNQVFKLYAPTTPFASVLCAFENVFAPCKWEMSCLVDDGTGQGVLLLEDSALVHQFLKLSRIKVSEIEEIATRANNHILEFSSARRAHLVQRVPLVTSTGTVTQQTETPSQQFGRRIDRPHLLRQLVVYGIVQEVGKNTTTTIDLGNNLKVRSKSLGRLLIRGVALEEHTATVDAWHLLTALENEKEYR